MSTGEKFISSGRYKKDLEALTEVVKSQKASATFLQRRLKVGYARAARLIEELEERGVIGPADGAKPRQVLVSSLEDIDS